MYRILKIGMDVHTTNYTLCALESKFGQSDAVLANITVSPELRNVVDFIKRIKQKMDPYGRDEIDVECGYEAGCLGYSLYHALTGCKVKCTILAPTTMSVEKGPRIKTDKRDARNIADCLSTGKYSAVHIPTEQDNAIKEYIRMRDDHKLALKKVKQQILSFCLRHNYRFDGTSRHWTQTHLKWLNSLQPEGLYREILREYLLTYVQLVEKLERLDRRIEELASEETYKEKVSKLSCFIGVKTITALTVLTEVGDFKRFASAQQFSSYLGLTPGEDSTSDNQNRLSITKAGNRHVRLLLVEAAQSFARGQVGYKSRLLKIRQEGNLPEVIAYADKANERLRRRYYRMVLRNNKKPNVAKIAIARELACFIWGMLTGRITALP